MVLKTVLVIDDSPQNLAVLGEVLQAEYQVRVANSGERGLRMAAAMPPPDLILLDVMMPGLDGYQVFDQLRAERATRDIPVIFVTAMGGPDAERRGLAAGAVDYIATPIVPTVLLARVHTQIELKSARDHLRDQNDFLEQEIARRMAENQRIQMVTIRALAHLCATRRPATISCGRRATSASLPRGCAPTRTSRRC
jgi:putative two-component system response regulator